MLIAVDLGYSQVKAIWDGGKVSFPSVIGEPVVDDLKDQGLSRLPVVDDLHLIVDGKPYYVGNKAIRDTANARLTLLADKTNDRSDKVKFLTVLGCALSQLFCARAEIVTGLPVDEYNDLKDTIRRNMSGTFDFSFRNKLLSIEVGDVQVIPQSAGAYYDLILKNDGSVDPAVGAVGSKVAVIDPGGRTTNVVMMDKARYIRKESFTIFTGVQQIQSAVRLAIHKRFKIILKPTQIDQVIRDRHINISGEQVPIDDLIAQATVPVVDMIVSEILMHIPDHRLVDHFIITGGGANLMGDAFMRAYSGHCILMDDAEFSNARGYYKYGLLKAKRK